MGWRIDGDGPPRVSSGQDPPQPGQSWRILGTASRPASQRKGVDDDAG